jgi:hypothetical protein
MQHQVVADAQALLWCAAEEGAKLGQQASLVQKINEQATELLEGLWSDEIEEVAQARSGGSIVVDEAEETPPACPMLTG